MSLAIADIALRAAAVAVLLVLAAVLARDAVRSLTGRLALALAVGTVAHAVTFDLAAGPPAAWHAPLQALATGNVVVLWLFCRALFDDEAGLDRRHVLIWGAVTGFGLLNCLVLAPAGGARLAVMAGNLLALGFIVLALIQVVRSWPADLVDSRRRLRAFVVVAALLYGSVNALLQIAITGLDAGQFANVVNAALLLAIAAAITVALLRIGAEDLFVAAAVTVDASPAPEVDRAEQKLIASLQRLMAEERIYRQENVTIGMLATRLAIPEYRLRRLINQRLGYRNFNAFVNDHRIAEAKAALADPTQAEVPVITIAMDAGFQSLGPFNRAFKALTGMTPTDYRRLKMPAAAVRTA